MTGTPEIPQTAPARTVKPKTVLVTGATGYIGGRLVPRLLEAGHTVKVLVRTPAKIAGVPWLADVEVVQSSLDDGDALRAALDGVDVLYYLVHSMAAGAGFESKEKAMAGTAARAAADAGVDRIVYLGGLHPASAELSTHMRSREAVGKVFLDSPVDAIVFQAGVVIGSGSASFEMIRHLSETLPLMPAPSWVRNKIEAIAVRDVLHYLVGAAALEGPINRTFDIGCRQVLSYAGHDAGIRRGGRAPPPRGPRASHSRAQARGLWVALVTPIPLSMSLPLVESLQHDAVSREHDIDSYIPLPEGGLTPYRRAVALALGKERDGQVETTWSNAGADADPLPSDPDWAGHRVYLDERSYSSDGGPEARLDHHRRDWRAERLVFACRWPGASAAGWTSSPAGPGCCAAGGTRTCWPKAKWWTGGGRSGSIAAGCSGCGPKCGRPAGPGWSSRWSRREPAAVTASGRSSSRRVSAAACTGWRCCRSTA